MLLERFLGVVGEERWRIGCAPLLGSCVAGQRAKVRAHCGCRGGAIGDAFVVGRGLIGVEREVLAERLVAELDVPRIA
jgi:hypothetical protein